jgi:hypothetical protein
MRVVSFICCVALLSGCAETSTPSADPGRFAHSAIFKTSAPWDGAAVALILAEGEMAKKPVAPYLSVRINRGVGELSNQPIRVEGKESRTGWAQWIASEGKSEPLSWVEVRIEAVKEGEPVKGWYEAAFPDGTRERGRFEAAWWPSEGRGG